MRNFKLSTIRAKSESPDGSRANNTNHSQKMKIEEYFRLSEDLSDSTSQLAGREIKRVPIGTFGGTRELLLIVEGDDLQAFDTGDQGGGQN